jgi:putative DNA primase/helicase
MDIVTFARLHGVSITNLIEDGLWHRCATESHPKKKNGAYMSRGAYGFIQDHANHLEPIAWKPDDDEIRAVDKDAMAARAREAAARIAADQQKAAQKAREMLEASIPSTHPYLASKGFPEHRVAVFDDKESGDRKMLLPMCVDGRVAGLQRISDKPGFEKKFLYGQRTSECTLVRGKPAPGAVPIFCEGYATGLSVERAMAHVRLPYFLVVCFTAGNLAKVAKAFGRGVVIADYDMPSKLHPDPGGHGIAVAKEIGLPFWQSDREGEDFNDFEQRMHAFGASMALKPFFMRRAA